MGRLCLRPKRNGRRSSPHHISGNLQSSIFNLQSPRQGFTLIEVLITLVILSTGIVLVLRAFGTAAAALGESRDGLWASLLAEEKIAEAIMAAEDDSAAGFAFSNGSLPAGGVEFLWRMRVQTIERLPSEMGAGNRPVVLNEMAVSIRRDGSTRERTATTYGIAGRRRVEGDAE